MLKNNTTIIYYTHNREDPRFEKKIQENILKTCGGLPIVSVQFAPPTKDNVYRYTNNDQDPILGYSGRGLRKVLKMNPVREN